MIKLIPRENIESEREKTSNTKPLISADKPLKSILQCSTINNAAHSFETKADSGKNLRYINRDNNIRYEALLDGLDFSLQLKPMKDFWKLSEGLFDLIARHELGEVWNKKE